MTTSWTLARKPDLDQVLARYFPGHRRHEHNGRAHYGERLSASALVAEFLKFVGAEVIFGIPGGASLPLNDAFTSAHDEGAFRYILTGHEQGAAFEAEGYAAASGRVGFCTATSGPGATNLITGLADAFRDSRPVIALTGNTATTAEAEAFQGLDIVGMTAGKATKGSFRPERPADVQEVLVQAYHLAVTGRPGSVLIDLPKDVQTGLVEMRRWESIVERYDWEPPRADQRDLGALRELLESAERPFLYVGHGVVLADAAAEVRALSHDLQIPVGSTVHALGVLESDDPLNLGMLGMHGSVVANLAAHRSDLTLILGARLDDRVVTAYPTRFAPHAKVVQVDADRRQLNRVRPVDLAIHGDVKLVLRQLREVLDASRIDQLHRKRQPWLDELNQIRQSMPIVSYDRADCPDLTHEFVYQTISSALRERGIREVIATFDVGTHQMKGAQWFPTSTPRTFITSGGMGSMGCAIPMAVGAALARPEALVLAAVGDGGFVMSSHELDTIGAYRLPVKIILFDDAHLGMVTNWHSLFFEGRKLTSDRRRGRSNEPVDVRHLVDRLITALEMAATADDLVRILGRATERLADSEWPAFALTAASYGIPAERIHTREQLPAAVERMLTAPGPYLLHLELSNLFQVYPLIPPGAPPEELIWRETEPGSGQVIRVRDRFDYATGRLRE